MQPSSALQQTKDFSTDHKSRQIFGRVVQAATATVSAQLRKLGSVRGYVDSWGLTIVVIRLNIPERYFNLFDHQH